MTNSVYPLSHRAVLSATGTETASFLNRVLTCNVETLAIGDGVYGALLTPQGKILTDMFVFSTDDGLLIDLPETEADAMQKRLTMLKLRADVQFTRRNDLHVLVFEGDPELPVLASMTPPNFGDDIKRVISETSVESSEQASTAYTRLRTDAVFPEFGVDYGPSEVFPADINMDLTNGIDFKKGCFVGQEVASRMKRKTEVRKRLLRVSAPEAAAEKDDEIKAGISTVGTVTSWAESEGLALVRLDRLANAIESATPVTINDKPAECHLPSA